VDVVTYTADGFLAAGHGQDGDGGTEAVIWTLARRRDLAADDGGAAGLATAGQAPQAITFAATRGNDTVISDNKSVWLSTDSGSAWTLARSRSITAPERDQRRVIRRLRPDRGPTGHDRERRLRRSGLLFAERADLAVRGHHRPGRGLDSQGGEGQ
jgi:hypothetical protein